MGLLDKATELDEIGKALRDRILRIPPGADVPYTALSLLKAYGSFQVGVCLYLENDMYSGYASVGLGLKKISVPVNYIYSSEKANETYFQFHDEEKKVFRFIEYGMDIWCFALDRENPWGAVLLLGSINPPSIEPWILSIILKEIQRIIHPRRKQNQDGSEVVESAEADIEPETAFDPDADLIELEPADEPKLLTAPDNFLEPEIESTPLVTEPDITSEPDEETEIPAPSSEDNRSETRNQTNEQLAEEPVFAVEPLPLDENTADEALSVSPDEDASAYEVLLAAEPAEESETTTVDIPESVSEPAPAEEAPVETIAPDTEQHDDSTSPHLLRTLDIRGNADGLLNGIIININEEAGDPMPGTSQMEKISKMVSFFAQVQELSPGRCLLLFSGEHDGELIAHRLRNSLKADVPLVFASKTPDEAYQIIHPYC